MANRHPISTYWLSVDTVLHDTTLIPVPRVALKADAGGHTDCLNRPKTRVLPDHHVVVLTIKTTHTTNYAWGE